MKLTKLNIAIDGNEANTAERVGSNVYAFSLLKELYQLTASKQCQVDILLSTLQVPDLPPVRKNWQYRLITPTRLWNMWALPIYLQQNRDRYDVFFSPGHYTPSSCPIPLVSSVMDLAFLEYPRFFKTKDLLQLKTGTKASVSRARKIITISRHSMRMIHKYYGVRAKDIEVAPPALDFSPPARRSTKDRQKLRRLGVSEPFIVYLGTIQPRKNLQNLIKAYEHLRAHWRKGKPPKLVIAGKVGWLAQPILKKIARSSYQQDILLTGFVNETEKRALFAWALCSVQIGLHEGFGIPALESLAYGTVPVVANSSSLPEVVGQAGILVDPTDYLSIAKGLKKACSLSPSQRTKLRHQGKLQVKKFSWKKSAQVVLQALQDVANK